MLNPPSTHLFDAAESFNASLDRSRSLRGEPVAGFPRWVWKTGRRAAELEPRSFAVAWAGVFTAAAALTAILLFGGWGAKSLVKTGLRRRGRAVDSEEENIEAQRAA